MPTIELPRRRTRPAHPFRLLLMTQGVTVTDAAEALAVSRPMLSAVLYGHRPASPALAARMALLEDALRQEERDGVGDGRA